MRRTGVARRFGPSLTLFTHFQRFLVRNALLPVQRVLYRIWTELPQGPCARVVLLSRMLDPRVRGAAGGGRVEGGWP